MTRTSAASITRTRTIVLFAPPQAQILDIVGPLQVFARASELIARPRRPPAYKIEIASLGPGKRIKTNSGATLIADRNITEVKRDIDTLLLGGGFDIADTAKNPALIAWLQRIAPHARRLGSVCTGAFILAQAGLLDGKVAATHWKWATDLARTFPQIEVDPESIFIRDGNLYTSAGVTAGMDLALALVEEDFGDALALAVARELVLYLRRPGGQSQFSIMLSLQASERKSFRDLQLWILDHLDEPLSVEVLATRAGMSPRNFAREFVRDIGMPPGQFLERVRIEMAQRRLEESYRSLEQIAEECGFTSDDSFRRSFRRVLKVSPKEYRARFHHRLPDARPTSLRRVRS